MSQGEEEANYYTEKDAASVLQWHDLALKRTCLWSIGPGQAQQQLYLVSILKVLYTKQ